jgi:hypothetical protein
MAHHTSPNPVRVAARLLALLPLAALPACSTAWKDHYRGVAAGAYEPTESVTIREVPWERVDATLRAIEAARAASDTHPDEWPPERLEAERAELLTGLQISADPAEIEILGRSVFRSTTPLRPGDGSLASFARSIGANFAVWSSNYLGTKEIVRQEAVRSTGIGFYGSYGHGKRHRYYEPWGRTTFVPVVIEADENAWVVYYLRRR